MAAPLKSTSANLHTKLPPFLCVSHETLAQQLHLQVVPSFLARTSSKLVSQEKTSKQCSKNCQSNNQCDSDNIVLRHRGKPIHHQLSQFSQHLSGGAR
jgi:hypothetical protein